MQRPAPITWQIGHVGSEFWNWRGLMTPRCTKNCWAFLQRCPIFDPRTPLETTNPRAWPTATLPSKSAANYPSPTSGHLQRMNAATQNDASVDSNLQPQ